MKRFIFISMAAIVLGTSVAISEYFFDDYSQLPIPNYINQDNTPLDNRISDAGATLGRILFYDKQLSANNTIACFSCHLQEFAFSDTADFSVGLDGEVTGRHSMRLVNARFGAERAFFWDKRAPTLEHQTVMPIQDHVEMGFSGTMGQPDMDSLTRKLNSIPYYRPFLHAAFGAEEFTQEHISKALAMFVRSIHSFDSRFDSGLVAVNNNLQAQFPNFTNEENRGKQLFLTQPPMGGAGCQTCHSAPEFDINPTSQNNGVIGGDGITPLDLTNTRAPSLRDLINPQGKLNGALMHNAAFHSLEEVIEHYNTVRPDPRNTNLDHRLEAPGRRLNLSDADKKALVAFLKTLTGSDMYSNPIWSSPFDENGNLTLRPTSIFEDYGSSSMLKAYPIPAYDEVHIEFKPETTHSSLRLYSIEGKQVMEQHFNTIPYSTFTTALSLGNYPAGSYLLVAQSGKHKSSLRVPIIK